MSDPVSQSEIEDVLASIRRLVTEGGRNVGAASPAPGDRPDSGKLVLTPALRVAEPDDPVMPRDVVQPSEPPQGAAPAEPEAAMVEIDDTAEARDDAAGDSLDLSPQMREAPHTAETRTEEPAATSEDTTPQEAAPQVESVSSLPEAPGTDADADPDIAPDADTDAHAGAPREPGPFGDAAETADDTIAAAGEPAPGHASGEALAAETSPEDDPSGEEAAHEARAASLESKIAELETMIGGTAQDWEPEDVEEEEYSPAQPIDWEDHAEDAGEPFAAASAGMAAGEARPDRRDERGFALFDDADTVIDEDMLRDMVAEIVREELQGALGERITRNVRKLVRREIHRALAAQDLE